MSKTIFSITLPAGWESALLGSPYHAEIATELTVAINTVTILDENNQVASVNYSVKTDDGIALTRADNFIYESTDALEDEAQTFLKGIFSGEVRG